MGHSADRQDRKTPTVKLRRRRDRRLRVTLSDVAKAAGVSSITVSRALRNPGKVSPDLRHTILRIADDMGYVPDFAARALASRNSEMVGIVFPTLSNSAFVTLMQGIEDRLHSSGFQIQYSNTDHDPAQEVQQLRRLIGQNPSGIIIAGLAVNQDIRMLLKQTSCPVVEIADLDENFVDMAIGIDHCHAAIMVSEHMLSKGYRRFGLLGGRADMRHLRRQAGYRQTMLAAGFFDPAMIMAADEPTSVGLGCRLLRQFLERFPDADGVFCQNDDVALGAVFECQRLGIRVPEDFGICGFNDLEFAALSEPSITSIHVPRYHVGFKAADMIIRANETTHRPDAFVNVGFALMERKTTARTATP